MLDCERRRCSIYDDRPLCCRLFPLDILRVDERLVWGVSSQCPSGNWLAVGSQRSSHVLDHGTVASIAAQLDALLSAEVREFMDRKEKVLSRVELLDYSFAVMQRA